MKKALILGHFLPFHKMHRALIEVVQALGCQPLIGLFVRENDPISPELRESWLTHYGEVLRVPVGNFPYDDLDPAHLPDVELIAGSNPEILKISQALGIPHFLWDPAREANPLDSADILRDPATHWSDMPHNVRQNIQRRITFVGPESVGKSWFARKMADKYGEPHIPEYGRPHEKYRTQGDYSAEELTELAKRHGASRQALSRLAGSVVFEDTDELMTAVWSEMLLEKESETVEAQITLPSLYILYHWDTPWEEDKLRYFARSDLRKKFFDRIEAKLQKHNASYEVVSGDWDERETRTIEIVEREIKSVKFS